MGMYVLTFFNICGGMTDGLTVFNDILAGLDVPRGVFMPIFDVYFNIIKLRY